MALLEGWLHCLSGSPLNLPASGLLSLSAPGLRRMETVPYREEMGRKAQRLRSPPCQDGEKLSQHQKLWVGRAGMKPVGQWSPNTGLCNAV